MSYASQTNQSQVDGDKSIVNDSNQATDTGLGSSQLTAALHDQKIEENNTTAHGTNATENEENIIQSNRPNLSEFYLLKGSSMAIYYGWQVVCLLIFIFTAYETLQNILPTVDHYPVPRQFFSNDSFVQDYPHGNLGAVQSKVALSDLSFVLFYAPWSADSQHARPALEAISQQFYREANFMAINCWQPNGECRQQYKKVMSWPVLMAYSKGSIAVPYNGQWTETALTRFMYLMLRPMHRIHKPDDLLAIIHNHDAVVTLFVNIHNSYTFYNIFYQTATKWLEKDPQGDIAFAVVTGEDMNLFGIENEPTLRLYLWNRTIEYDDEVWKVSLIHKWLIENRQQVTHWLAPPGSRSKEFDTFVQKGPVLVLFTPRNLFDFSSDAYAMIRQIAYEYNNCGDDGWLKEMGRNYIHAQRKINAGHQFLKTKECEKILDWRNSASNRCAPYERSALIGLANSTKFQFGKPKPRAMEYCEKLPDLNQAFEKTTFFEHGLPTSILDTKNDLQSSENIFDMWREINCKMLKLSMKIRSKMYQDPHLDKVSELNKLEFDKITGLACKTNKTLSFLAMDSLYYGLVAERLGISLKAAVQNTAAIIIDGKDESSYLLFGPLNTSNLIDFVYNYTTKKLTRHLRDDGNSKHSHFYSSANSQSNAHYHPNAELRSSNRRMESVSLTTLSSKNFSDYITDPYRTVAVLFTSSQCAFCTIFSSTLLSIVRILGDTSYLKIARIDSDKNDLPWQYTMETVPAFIIFNNKLESRKFPTTMKVSVQNVIGFILANLSRPNRLTALTAIVNYRRKHKQPIEHTISVLRRETEDSIVASLRAWRANARKRTYILRRIQALRRLYFTIYSHNLTKVDELIKEVVHVWRHESPLTKTS